MANHHTADGTNAVAALKNAYCAHLSEDDENLTESNLDAMRHNTESLHLIYVAFQSHWTKGDEAGADMEDCVAFFQSAMLFVMDKILPKNNYRKWYKQRRRLRCPRTTRPRRKQ
jgi:hypothetical protein